MTWIGRASIRIRILTTTFLVGHNTPQIRPSHSRRFIPSKVYTNKLFWQLTKIFSRISQGFFRNYFFGRRSFRVSPISWPLISIPQNSTFPTQSWNVIQNRSKSARKYRERYENTTLSWQFILAKSNFPHVTHKNEYRWKFVKEWLLASTYS